MPFHKQNKELEALADELASFPAFASLDRKSLLALAGTGRVVHLPAGWALMSEDTPADSVYALLGGDTEVRHGSEVLTTLTGGALVGEAALISRRRRNASVITTSEVRAMRLNYDDLPALFGRYADIEDVFRREWERKAATSAPV
ncbi:MAG: cyclic nucleotide-binding domain-containing protein [Mycobacteriales bacterium]